MVIAVLVLTFLLPCLPGLALSSPRTEHGNSKKGHEPVAPQAHVRDAHRHIRAGQYARALVAIDRGIAAHPRHLQLLQLRASLLLETRDFEAARVAFEALLDAGVAGPNRRKVYSIIRRLRRLGDTSVTIAVNMPADVYIDYKALGMICGKATQCKKRLLPGRYRILVERQGFAPVRKRVRLQRNRVINLTVELEELPSPITVRVYPSDAQVLLNGRPWDPSAGNTTISAGEHVLEVRRRGYFAEETTISARLGQPVAVDIALDRRIPLRISPPGATLTLDGRSVALESPAVELVGDSRRPMMTGFLRLPYHMAQTGSDRALHPMGYTLLARKKDYADARVELPSPSSPSSSLSPSAPAEQPAIAVDVATAVTITLAPLPPPMPSPPGRPWHKPALVSAASAAAVAGFSMTVYYRLNARAQLRRAQGECSSTQNGYTCNPVGYTTIERARTAARRANVSTAIGLAASAGTLWASHLSAEPASDDRMPIERKLSIAGAVAIATAGMSIATVYGWRAYGQWRYSEAARCSGSSACEQYRVGLAEQARDDAHTAVLALSTAGVAAMAAGMLWRMAPWSEDDGKRKRIHLNADMGPGRVGASVSLPLP